MSTEPKCFKPPLSLLVKLGSLIVHCQEFQSGKGHQFDKITFDSLLADDEVIAWIEEMNSMALLPLQRT